MLLQGPKPGVRAAGVLPTKQSPLYARQDPGEWVWTVHLPDCRVSLTILLRLAAIWSLHVFDEACSYSSDCNFGKCSLNFGWCPYFQSICSICSQGAIWRSQGWSIPKMVECLLWLFNRMLAVYFLEHLSAGTVVYTLWWRIFLMQTCIFLWPNDMPMISIWYAKETSLSLLRDDKSTGIG